jgi:hypothetical protein
VRGDFTFREQILDIADDGTNDWVTAKNGAQVVNKELVLRSKLRIEARQFHMSRLHPQQWGEKQTIPYGKIPCGPGSSDRTDLRPPRTSATTAPGSRLAATIARFCS